MVVVERETVARVPMTSSSGRARERLPMQVKPLVPEGIDALLEELHNPGRPYPEQTDCWKCEKVLSLEDVSFQWPIGHFDFHFGKVPAYCCAGCNETYFPRPVLNALSECVEKEMVRLNPQPTFRNADRIRVTV